MSHSPGPGTPPASSPPPGFKAGVKLGFRRGISRGIHGFLFIVKILVPVSLVFLLLDRTGWLYALDPLFSPAMALINLPPQAALPILTALFSSFYAAVGMMVVIPFTHAQFILMSIFISIAHMIVIEGLIQHRAGIHMAAIVSIRLVAAGLTVYVASLFFPGTEIPVVMPENLGLQLPLVDALLAWALSTLTLMLRIILIIVPVMIVLETLKELGLTDRIAGLFRPFMALLGLSPNVATMWVTGTFFGIVYGSAVIHDEATSGRFTGDELKRLHISLGLSHSMVEDPALFLALGIGMQWSVLPRLLSAAMAVHLYRLLHAVRTRRRASPQRRAY
ncbi:MAG: iron transporter [Dehalococcoidia bacterium]|nr:MAG: iron transporter [Dehalococcoidia bacterium]